ncbi:MAG: hypothetical protein JNK82_10560 [Myxococcaceae bacterium]|nr:hypothetical protein [Myxococcaceae bacterium]
MPTALLGLMLLVAPADFEQELVDRAVAQLGGTIVPQPEGSIIDEVLISSDEIMSERDPWPNFFNWFHADTRRHIVEREVLLSPGEPWDAERALETERNLRRMVIFAVVRVVAIRRDGPPGHVSLLVTTKDRWSLRLNSEFTIVGNLVQYLRLRPAEMNFLGRNVQAAADVLMKLDTIDFGQYLLFPRLFGQKFRLAETASLVFNRNTARLEGSTGYVLVDRPFYSLGQRWAWAAFGQWNSRRQRVFRGATVWELESPSAGLVPFEYDARSFSVEANATRRFGTHWLLDVTLGGFGYDSVARPPGELSAEQGEFLRREYLPRSESAAGLAARLRFFEARFIKLRNIDTLEISEDFQLGPLVQSATRWALPLPFTSTPGVPTGNGFLETTLSVRYRWYFGGDLLTVSASGTARFITGGLPQNRRYLFEVVNYSPLFEGGRLYTRLVADIRQNDLNNTQVLLGGGNGLRGTAPDELTGRNYLLGNFEYRTRPFEIATVYTSIVLFYDVGSAFADHPTFIHTTGIGLRIMLPQFNQEVLRVNLGLVIGGGPASLSRLVTTLSEPQGLGPDFLNNPP